jgi:hypothetical protein
MKTIQTKPDCTLGFVELPVAPKKWNEETIELYLNACKEFTKTSLTEEMLGLKKAPELIGKLSEITEEQAKELVYFDEKWIYWINKENKLLSSESNPANITYLPLTKMKDILNDVYYQIHNDNLRALKKLIIEVVGIKEEEFDKYLVIKL